MTDVTVTVKYNNGATDVVDTITVNSEGDRIVKGTITAAPGYIITGVSGARYRGRPGRYFTVSDFVATKISDYQYSYNFTSPPNNITISVQTKKEPGSINVDTTGLVNCSVTPSKVLQGTQTTLTLNADNGYILNGSGSYTVDGTTTSFNCTNVASYQITITADTSVSVSYTATKVAEPDSGSIVHTYVLSEDAYNQVGKQIIIGVNDTGTGFESYDYTRFVNYLYQIPFKVGNDITTSSSSINLGKQSLSIDCQRVTHETLNVELGSIDLTDVHNSNDLQPISTTLYSPFSKNINLPPTVIGSKIYLSFSINLKTEQGLLLIKQNDNLIYSGQTELFTDLPLYFTAGNQDILVRQFKTQYQNQIKQAYVVVSYHKAITDLTSYKTTEHGKLSDYKGFTRVSHGTIKHSINSTIDNALLNLLRQGVIIK